MTYKDILAAVLTLNEDEAALVSAGALAEKFGARAAALIVAIQLGSEFAQDAPPLSEVLADIAKGSHSAAARERERIIAWLETSPHDFDVRDMTVEGALNKDEIIAQARLADLVVMARAGTHQRARRVLWEHILFQSGRPVLLVPGAPVKPSACEHIMIAWNAKAEAMRAVTAAMPLLQAAREVSIVTIDALPSPSGHAQAPGRELAAHLARRDVKVEVRNVDGMGRGDSRALLDESVNCNADLIVMGAYGHSRAQEFLFGGVTHDFLHSAPLPLFMAH